MYKTLTLIISFLIFSNIIIYGQSITDQLNKLPPTLVERAPEFDIEKKFDFSFDSINNLLIIQEIHRKPDTKEIHFYQTIYEIPLSDLAIGSFRVAKDPYDDSKLVLKIGTVKDRASIIYYSIGTEEVILIQTQGEINLGSWNYSEDLKNEINNTLKALIELVPNKSYETNIFVKTGEVGGYKYLSERVTFPSATVNNKVLNDDYYYSSSLKSPTFYSGTNNEYSSNLKFGKDLKTELIRNNIQIGKSPVLIHIDENGILKSLFVMNLSNEENRKLDLSKFSNFSPGNDGSGNLKTKYLFFY